MIFSIRSAQIFNEQCSMNESQIWISLSTFACKSMLNWLNWMLDQLSKHQRSQLLALSLALCLLNSCYQSLHERNSEYWISISARKSYLRKNSASNAKSQNIKHITVLKWLKCIRSLRIWKIICFRQSSDWEWYTYILFHQHVWWFI